MFARVPVPRGLLYLLVGAAVRGCVVGAAPRHSWLGRRGVCVFVRAPRLFPAFPGWGLLCGRACWARVWAVPRPSWLGGWGVFCFLFFCGGGACHVLALWCRPLAVPVPGLVVSVPRSPLFWAGLLALFFSRPSVVCVRAFSVSLFPVGRCSWLGAAGFGWVVPLCPFGGSCLLCLLGGGFGRLLRCWWAVWWLWAVLLPPSPVFFWGGVRLFLPLPSLGWRTHWSAFSVVIRVAVGGCVLSGRVPAPWVGWVMYTLGSAPLTAGLGSGSAGWAAAPGGFVWIWIRGAGVVRVLSPPRCRF